MDVVKGGMYIPPSVPVGEELATYEFLRKLLTEDYRNQLTAKKDTVFSLCFADGPKTVAAKWLVFNLIFWKPLLSRNLPISFARHGFIDEPLTNDVRIRIHTNIYDDVLRSSPEGANSNYVVSSRFELVDAISEIYNYIAIHLAAYQRSISIRTISKTMQTPELKAASTIDLEPELKVGIKAVENKLKKSYETILDRFADKTIVPNVFAPYLRNGALSSAQFPQCVGAAGTRTDTDDRMVTLPIRRSYLDGLEDIKAYAIDSLQAKKSKLYNNEEMPNTQYSNRKQQLLASCIQYLYAGDCGSNVYVMFPIRERYKKNVIGKYIFDEGRLVELYAGNIDRYVNKTVMLRSPLTCRHTDGICQTCGGRLTLNMSLETVPGILSAILVMAPIAQLVLSSKHFAKTLATLFALPRELSTFMVAQQNEIRIQPLDNSYDPKKIWIATPTTDVRRMLDLDQAKGETIRNDVYFSSLRTIMVGYKRSPDEAPELLSGLIPLVGKKDSNNPYFSAAFLGMVRDNPDMMMVDGDLTWFSMEKFDTSKPLIRCVAVNQSTRQLVRRIEHMFTDELSEFTSLSEALTTVTDTIWEKTNPNLMHVEVMLKASLITSASNYDVPMVEDPNAVMFGKLGRIIPRRSIGTQIAFERFMPYVTAPETFVLPKKPGPLDVFMNFV